MMNSYTQLRSLTRDAADLILQKKKNATAGPMPPGMQDAVPPATAMPPQQQRAPLTAQGTGKPVGMPFVQEPQKVVGPMVKPQGGSVAQQSGVNATPMMKWHTDPKEQQGAQRWLDSVTRPGAAPYRPPEPAVHDMVQRGLASPQTMTMEKRHDDGAPQGLPPELLVMKHPQTGKGGAPGAAGGYDVPQNTTGLNRHDAEAEMRPGNLSPEERRMHDDLGRLIGGQSRQAPQSPEDAARLSELVKQAMISERKHAGAPVQLLSQNGVDGQAQVKAPAVRGQGPANAQTEVNATASTGEQGQEAARATPSRAEAASAMRAEAERKAAAAQLENARKAGAVIENGKTVPHPDGKGGLLHQTGFAADSFRNDEEMGPVIPYRDDHGKQHPIKVNDITRVTDKDGKASYQFMAGGKAVSVPEGKMPLFQVDEAGRRYTTTADGTRQELGADTRTMAQKGVDARVAAADKALQEKLAQGAQLAGQIKDKQAQAAAAQQRLEAAHQAVAAADQSTGPDSQTKRIQAREERIRAEEALAQRQQEVQALQKQHDEHYRALNHEMRARQAEISRYQSAAAESPRDEPWQKDARSVHGEARVTDVNNIAAAEKQDPAAAAAMRQGQVGQPTQRVFDAAEKSFGAQPGQQPEPGKSMTLHEMLMQAPAMTQGKGERQITVDQAAAARATAQGALGIADPENVRVTRGADGVCTLSRKAADGSGADVPFATLDPKTNRITLKAGADGRIGQHALDMAAHSTPGSTPVYLPGSQPPMSESEVSDLIKKGTEASSSAKDRKAAEAALTQAGLSPEGISQMVQQGRLSVQDGQLLNNKFNGGVSSYAGREKAEAAQRQDAGLQQMYEQGKGAKDKPNFKSWLEKGDPQRDAQVQARAKELGVSEDEVRRDLETRRVMDFSTPLTQKGHDEQSGVINGLRRGLGIGGFEDSTRLLPNGGLAVNPSLGEDQSKFEQAVNSSSASKEAKEAALKQWPAYHDAWLTKATDTLKASKTLPGIQDYNEWLTSNTAAGHFSEKRPDGSVRQYTDNEKTQLYLDAMKGRSGLRKFMDNVSTSLVAGGGQVVAGVLGAEALARNTFQDITGLDIGGKQVSEAAAAMARQNQALTQSHDLTGTTGSTGSRFLSNLIQAVPSVGIAIASGGTAGLILSAAQSAGSAYTDLLQHHIMAGDTIEEAHRKAAGTAIASGAVSLALSKIMPGGAQALNNPATRELAKKSFAATVKGALKGASEEAVQEAIDGGFSHIAAEMNKGKTFHEAATSYAEQYPQSALTSALLGGGVQAMADTKSSGAQQQPATAPQSTPSQPPATAQQTSSLPPPTTAPKSPEDSQKLIDNVSKMPPEAQQHPQVQADLEQAKQVVAEGEAKNEGQKQPGASDSGNAGTPPESQARIPDNTNSGTEGRPAADDSQPPRPPGSEAKDAPPVPAATDSGPTSQTAASDSNSAQTPPVPSSEQPPSTADKKGETQAPPSVQPTTPPKSVEDSRKLMENVSKMPTEARQHPQVQADLEQAKKVLQDHVQKLETQKGPLSEAQKKDLADAKAALARQAPGRAASIPDSGKETPPAETSPAARTQQPESAVRPEDAARPAEATPESTRRQRTAEAPQTDAPDGKKLPQGEPGNAGADAQRINTETGHADAEAGSDVRDRQPSDPARSTAEPADASTGKRASTDTRARISPDAAPQDQASGAERSRDGSAADSSRSTIPEDTTHSDSDPAQPKTAAGDEARYPTPPDSGTNVGSSPRTASSDQPAQTTPTAPRGPGEGGSPGQPSPPSPTSLPPPRTPPLSVEQSQRLIDNVSKMPPEARLHPQVQADLRQARDVLNAQSPNKTSAEASQETPPHIREPEAHGAIPPPGNLPPKPAWVSPALVDHWNGKLDAARVRDPADHTEILEHLENLGPLNRLHVYRAVQSFLDLLPGDITRSLTRFHMRGESAASIKEKVGHEARGSWSPSRVDKVHRGHGVFQEATVPATILISHDLNGDETALRTTVWHEMTHWLWDEAGRADAPPRLAQWRRDLEQHFHERTAYDQPQKDNKQGFWFLPDHWIENYSGKISNTEPTAQLLENPPVIELATTYMEKFAVGGLGAARWKIVKDSDSTFNIVFSILGDK